MTFALEIKNLVKTYPNNNKALSNINLNIEKGDFFALLGSNGAGKTTIINIICGLLNKTSGNISVLNLAQEKYPNKIKSLIGLMGQEFNFSLFEPIDEILINQAGYYGISRKIAQLKAYELLEKLNLLEKRKEIAQTLSGGMKRRLMLARALIHNPKILILDEPTAGVDIEIRHTMWEYVQQLNKEQGVTVILTTHYLEEAEYLCKNIAIIDKGKVVIQTNMNSLLKKVINQVLILESKKELPENINIGNLTCSRLDNFSIKVNLTAKSSISTLLALLQEQKIEIYNIKQTKNKLETLFIDIIKK